VAELAPSRFGPVSAETLVAQGLWQYAHYYDPVSTESAASR